MPFGGLGMWEVLLILLVLLLVFGAKRLPELGGALGKGIREFKGSVREIEREISREEVSRELNKGKARETPTPAPPAKEAATVEAEAPATDAK